MQNRRKFLGAFTSLAAGAFFSIGRRAFSAEEHARIDVHHHFFPPPLVSELVRANQNVFKGWTVEKSLADMDQAGVSKAILSITTPGVSFLEGERARKMARDCNEYAARLASDHAGRFGLFAVLPWPDVDASLRELEYSLDTLKADGIGMLTSYEGKWFGDPYMAPVFDELNRRKTVVYTHPTSPKCCGNLVPDVPDSAIEYGTDTSRAIARTVFSGTSMHYRDIRFVFSHAGGSMPFLVERFVNLAKTPQYAGQLPKGFLAEATRFYYDTAQASNAAAMSALKKVIPVSQIAYGTDYPYRTSVEHVKGLRECGVFSASEIEAIERTNAMRLLSRKT